jgi:hypothetical protein
MIRAIVIKELREVRGIAALALVGYALVVVSAMGLPLPTTRLVSPGDVPFMDDGFYQLFLVVSILFMVTLGLRQSLGETRRGTWLFLLHRPIARDTVFLLKLATGCCVFFLCATVPVITLGSWAVIPGHHAGPFEWSMTMPDWQLIFALPIVYTGAFLSGLRPARWFGTRLLPLVGCGMAVTCILYTNRWLLIGLPLTIALYVALAVVVCHVARTRDFA